MRNTIRNVITVVAVLMMSCQVSLKPKIGPVIAHAAITNTATVKASGLPVAFAVNLVKRVNHDLDLVGLMYADCSNLSARPARSPRAASWCGLFRCGRPS